MHEHTIVQLSRSCKATRSMPATPCAISTFTFSLDRSPNGNESPGWTVCAIPPPLAPCLLWMGALNGNETPWWPVCAIHNPQHHIFSRLEPPTAVKTEMNSLLSPTILTPHFGTVAGRVHFQHVDVHHHSSGIFGLEHLWKLPTKLLTYAWSFFNDFGARLSDNNNLLVQSLWVFVLPLPWLWQFPESIWWTDQVSEKMVGVHLAAGVHVGVLHMDLTAALSIQCLHRITLLLAWLV